jgi:hypothetical protein
LDDVNDGFVVSGFEGLDKRVVFKGYAWVNEVLTAKRKELVLCHGEISVGQEKKQRRTLSGTPPGENLSLTTCQRVTSTGS